MDIATANRLSGDVSIIQGRGDGIFDPSQLIFVGGQPSAVAIGDFTSDAIIDIVVANAEANNVLVLRGVGDGNFDVGQRFQVGDGPSAVVVADFNQDAVIDLAVSNFDSNDISLLMGNGDGTFAQPRTFFVTGEGPISITPGDFNGDGSLDVATSNFKSNDISIFINDGNGGLMLSQTIPVGDGPVSLITGEFIRSYLGIAVANFDSNESLILLGREDGRWGVDRQNYSVVTAPTSIAAGDYNNDGRLDLSVLGDEGRGLKVLLDNGNERYHLIR